MKMSGHFIFVFVFTFVFLFLFLFVFLFLLTLVFVNNFCILFNICICIWINPLLPVERDRVENIKSTAVLVGPSAYSGLGLLLDSNKGSTADSC